MSAAGRKLTQTTLDFLAKASGQYGKIAEERFDQDLWANLMERTSDSPIEDLFVIACHMHCFSMLEPLNPDPVDLPDGKARLGRGIHVFSQARIGKFRVDFLVEQVGIGPEDVYTPVIVELDGHDFHERNKKERSYEKARDRYFVKEGYRVVHFTGSDVVKDPYQVAFEVLEMVGLFTGMGREAYDPADPLGMGW